MVKVRTRRKPDPSVVREQRSTYSAGTGVNSSVYRDAFAQYGRWNDLKQQERIEFESDMTPVQAWQRYRLLWEFVANNMPPETKLQAKQKAMDIERYLERIQVFERKRRENTNSTRNSSAASRTRSRKK